MQWKWYGTDLSNFLHVCCHDMDQQSYFACIYWRYLFLCKPYKNKGGGGGISFAISCCQVLKLSVYHIFHLGNGLFAHIVKLYLGLGFPLQCTHWSGLSLSKTPSPVPIQEMTEQDPPLSATKNNNRPALLYTGAMTVLTSGFWVSTATIISHHFMFFLPPSHTTRYRCQKRTLGLQVCLAKVTPRSSFSAVVNTKLPPGSCKVSEPHASSANILSIHTGVLVFLS